MGLDESRWPKIIMPEQYTPANYNDEILIDIMTNVSNSIIGKENVVTVEMTVEMMENFGTPDEAIDAAIVGIEQGIEEGTTPLGILKSTPWGTLFIAIFALIASLFIKKNPPVSDRIN